MGSLGWESVLVSVIDQHCCAAVTSIQ